MAAARCLALPVAFLAALAALAGLLPQESGGPVGQINAWGHPVRLDGHGLYSRESASGAAQERGQDLVTLIVALPLLLAAWRRSRMGNPAGRVMLAGIFGYFLYAYGLMAFGAVFNPLFLVYVAIFSLGLFGFVLAMLSVDADGLSAALAADYPRRKVIAVSLFVGGLLGLLWLARVVPPSLDGSQPVGLDGYHTLFVQAADLGVLVPVAFLSAWWLWRRDVRGGLLGTVLMVKGCAMGLAVGTMGVSMNLSGNGADAPLPLIAIFYALALAGGANAWLALRSFDRSA